MNKDLASKKFCLCVTNFELNYLGTLEICLKLTNLNILSVIFFVCMCDLQVWYRFVGECFVLLLKLNKEMFFFSFSTPKEAQTLK